MGKARYHLRFCGAPLCDCMGRLAYRSLMEAAEITSCSYTTIRSARAAMRRLNRRPGWAGCAEVRAGDCPIAVAVLDDDTPPVA